MCAHHDHIFTIDIHTHILPERIPDFKKKFGYGGFIYLEHHAPCRAKMMQDGKFFREIEDNCWDADTRIKECGVHHVDVQVLSTIPVMFNYWAKPEHTLYISKFLNDHIAEVVNRYPRRFVGLGTVPLQDTDLAISELERCKSIGLVGVEIGTHVNDMNLDAPQLFPFFEACQDLNMSVFVHPWDMMGKEKMPKYWLPWLVGMPAESSLAICSLIFGGVFERLPNLRVAVAHGGGSFAATFGRIAHGFEVRPDLCAIDNPFHPSKYLGKFWVDSLVHDINMLDFIIRMFGADKVALGTDYPFPLGELRPGELIEQFTDDIELKKKLLHEAALQWLDMSIYHFYKEPKRTRI